MKITITIEVNGDNAPTVNVATATTEPTRGRGRPPKQPVIADVAPPPIPALPEPEPVNGSLKPGSGPQFDPGFLKIVQDAPEPFTRRSLAISTGLNVVDVTARLNRLHHRGWIIQPARELWKRTAKFGVKE